MKEFLFMCRAFGKFIGEMKRLGSNLDTFVKEQYHIERR